MEMKLGKKPARPEAVKFKLANYVDKRLLPKPPLHFGHEALIGAEWQMLGNDQWGDCVWAGAAHETMMWNKVAGRSISFDDKTVLSDYSAATGFNPDDPNTDQGSDMKEAASYRRKTGIVDSAGVRHKIAAYLSIAAGDLHEHYLAMYLFGAVGIGIQFPNTAMDQFNHRHPWTVISKSKIEGGHYIPLIAKRSHLECVTWGKVQPMTGKFFAKYNDESVAYVSDEMLTEGKSPEGFDLATLQRDLSQLKKA